MALWGNKDSVYSDGTVAVNYTNLTVTGTGATFTTAGISTGDVIQIGAGSTFGEAVITAVSSASTISIASTQFLSGTSISGAIYNINQQPKYALGVGQTVTRGSVNPSLVYGVDYVEVGSAATTVFAVAHSGWVAVGATYIDSEGNLRCKSEVLVAGGIDATAGTDAADDDLFPDPVITIVSEPASVGIGTTDDAVFMVEAEVTPDYAPLSYQWQEDDGGGFGDLSDGGDYSGTTTPILTVANNDDKDEFEYQVIIRSGDSSATSGIASITYV
jgi:hypothetical protein